MPLSDQKPSTSRNCRKQLSPKQRSPWKNAGGKVNRFKKVVDDQARRLVRRSLCIVKDNQVVKKVTPNKLGSQQRKVSKRLINKRRKNLKKPAKARTLEEGEICSDTDLTKNAEDDENDCLVIEPTLEEITIDDTDEDNMPTTSDLTTNYQSLINSFKERVSSTPCHSKKSPNSHNAEPKADDILPFFIDVGRSCGTESINSTDNFTDYIKFSTLKDKSDPKYRSVRLIQNADAGEVIDLDDTSNDLTLKRKSAELDDDSVIFISETNKTDFISIVDNNLPPHKIFKPSEATLKTPANRLHSNNLFTQSETKKLNEYNENAYNPSDTKVPSSGKRMVIIDGSNVAFKHGLDQQFSVKGLKIAIEYFEKLGHEVKAVIPQFRMNKTKSTSPDDLEKLHKAGKIVQTPCKNLPGYTSTSYDDRFILQLAYTTDAAIVSNDNYRDLLHENPAFKKIIENRVIGYTWCNDIFILPKDPYGKWGPTLHSILNRC